jgi:hypothetical protein
MMKLISRFFLFFICYSIITFTVLGAETVKHAVIPNNGFVPDAETAIRVAEAIWLPIYGKGIYQRKPFVAHLNGDVWVVEGSLPKGVLGGVPLAEISKSDGRVLRVTHGK